MLRIGWTTYWTCCFQQSEDKGSFKGYNSARWKTRPSITSQSLLPFITRCLRPRLAILMYVAFVTSDVWRGLLAILVGETQSLPTSRFVAEMDTQRTWHYHLSFVALLIWFPYGSMCVYIYAYYMHMLYKVFSLSIESVGKFCMCRRFRSSMIQSRPWRERKCGEWRDR